MSNQTINALSRRTPPSTSGARCGTIVQIRDLFKLHLGHTPCDLTIRTRLDEWKIPRFKANPAAKKGGGPCYYSIHHIEKQLRSLMLPGRLQPVEVGQ